MKSPCSVANVAFVECLLLIWFSAILLTI